MKSKKMLTLAFSLTLAFTAHAQAGQRHKTPFDQIVRGFSRMFSGFRDTTATATNTQAHFTGEAAEGLYYILGGNLTRDRHAEAFDMHCDAVYENNNAGGNQQNGQQNNQNQQQQALRDQAANPQQANNQVQDNNQQPEPTWYDCTLLLPDRPDLGEVSLGPHTMTFIQILKSQGINPANVASIKCDEDMQSLEDVCEVVQ